MFDHFTVLKNEAVEGLNIHPDGIYVDCTLGGGGHSEKIVRQLTTGHLYAFDQDLTAIEAAQHRLEKYSKNITFIHQNFRFLKEALIDKEIQEVDGILYDLGVSSPQFDQAERGFSYQNSGPLDMRMDQTQTLSAYQVVNEWPYESLVGIFFKYGEEKFSKQIARKIEAFRKNKPIETTEELAELIKEGIPAATRRKGGHPAKRVFQALRIAVNDELQVFENSLEQAISLIKISGRISVITFHSLEDRICKATFKKYSSLPDLPHGLPVIPEGLEPPLKLINRKPVVASESELEKNRRSRSAKLRIAEKIKSIRED